MSGKRPRTCILGWHRWFQDGAMFSSADRCSRCGVWRTSAGARVERERALWEKYDDPADVARELLRGWSA